MYALVRRVLCFASDPHSTWNDECHINPDGVTYSIETRIMERSGALRQFLPSFTKAVPPAGAASSSQSGCPAAPNPLKVRFAQSRIILAVRLRTFGLGEVA
jgi:hypothetical protein